MKIFYKEKDLMVTWLFTVLLVITTGYDVVFNESLKLFRIILVAITIWVAYLSYRKTFFRKCTSLYYLILIFIFASMYLASVWDFYGIPNYDKYLHLASGVIVAIVGYVVYLYLYNTKDQQAVSPIASVVFVIAFSIAVAGVWEMWEFATDSIFGLNAQNGSLIDTMLDIYCGSIVGIATSVPIYINSKGKKIKAIQHIIDEMNKE